MVVEIHFEDAQNLYVVVSKSPCAQPTERHWWVISQEGHFGKHTASRERPNVPVVWIELAASNDGATAGVRTYAQVDTGYDDVAWPHTVLVNDAQWQKIKNLSPSPVQVGEVSATTCQGLSVKYPVYVVPMKELRVEDEREALMRAFSSIYIIPYPQEMASNSCGGISTWNEPAAQLGASFLREFGTTVFVPEAAMDAEGRSIGQLWIRQAQKP